MANEVRLIEELRRLADLDPPICSKDKASEIEVFGRSVTVYCKPFEQFQDTLRQAADRIEELESLRTKGRWKSLGCGVFVCGRCWSYVEYESRKCGHNYCPNCGAKMEG